MALVLTDDTALDEPDGPAAPSGPALDDDAWIIFTSGIHRCPQGRRRDPSGRRGVRRRGGRAVRARRAARTRGSRARRALGGVRRLLRGDVAGVAAWGVPRARPRVRSCARAWTSGRGWWPRASPSCPRCPPSPGCGPPTRSTRCASSSSAARPARPAWSSGSWHRGARCGTPTDRRRRPSSPAPHRWRPTGRCASGCPLAGWDLAVVDAGGVPVPAGEIGELIIGGVGLARYLDPDKDAERFAPMPTLGLAPRLSERRPRGARPGGPGVRRAWRRAGEARRSPDRARRGRRGAAGTARRVGGGRRGADDRRRQPGAGRLPRAAPARRSTCRRPAPSCARRSRPRSCPLLAVVDDLPDAHLGQGRPTRAPVAAAHDGLDGRGATVRAPAVTWLQSAGRTCSARLSTDADADFFELGGGSLSAAQLVSALRDPLPAGHRRRRVRLPGL